jgi:CopG family nickel-responsive transcriptional regulator
VAEVVRFSVSLEADLLEEFDRYCQEGRFATRSEAIRQLLREALTAHAWESDAQDAAATLTIVYDHHRTHLAERLLELQHRHPDRVVSTMTSISTTTTAWRLSSCVAGPGRCRKWPRSYEG